MFSETTIKALQNFQASVDRLAAAIERLKEFGANFAPVTGAEAPGAEKKPVTLKTKKNTSSESAASAAPATQVPPAAPPASGPETALPSAPPPQTASAGSFLDEDIPAPVTFTVEQVRAEAIKCAGVKSEDWVKDVIRTIGNAPKISEIKPEKYAAVMARFAEGMKG